MEYRKKIYKNLSKALINYDIDKIKDLCAQAIENKIDAYEAISKGLFPGIEVVGKKYDTGELFVPELLMAAKAMKQAIEILKPHISGKEITERGTLLIGTVKGDLHDIGKDIVAILMEASGFKVYNLGVNLENDTFLEKANEYNADIIGLSSLMSTTMNHMKDIIELFKREGMREKYLIMVGGAPVSQRWCNMIGADGYAPNAGKAIEVAQDLLKNSRTNK